MKNNVAVGITKVMITIIALIFATVHIIRPDLTIDSVTLGLIVIAILPWISPMVQSFELPGGLKVQFREMKKATEKIEKAGLLPIRPKEEYKYMFQRVSEEDPILALASLRIEIENRLREIAGKRDIPIHKKGAGQLLNELSRSDILTKEERSALADLMSILNKAVHGAQLNEKAAQWAIEIGPRVLEGLDEKIEFSY